MQYLYRILALCIGYLFGCFQSAELVLRIKKHSADIRTVGTGIPGTANMMQQFGASAGFFTFLLDAGKGSAGIALSWLLPMEHVLCTAYAGVGVLAGHCWPAHRKFRGGRGIACLYGISVMFSLANMGIVLACELLGLILSRIMIGGALGANVGILAGVWILPYSLEVRIVTFAMWAIVFIRHLGKIGSIIRGEEMKFSFGKLFGFMRSKKGEHNSREK